MKPSHGFGERLKLLADAAGSGNRFGDLTGVTSGTMSHWQTRNAVRPSLVQKCANTAGVSYEWLMFGQGDTEQEIRKFLVELPGLVEKYESSRVKETPARYGAEPPKEEGDVERIIDHFSPRLDERALHDVQNAVLRDAHLSGEVSRRAATRINEHLGRRLSQMQKQSQSKS